MDSALVISSIVAACVSVVSLILNVAILVRLSGLKRGASPATAAAPSRPPESQFSRRPQGPQNDDRRGGRPQYQDQQQRPRPVQPPAPYDSLRDINLRLKNAERFQERARQETREATAEVSGGQSRPQGQQGNNGQPSYSGQSGQGGGFRHDRDRDRRRRRGGRHRSHDGRPPYRQDGGGSSGYGSQPSAAPQGPSSSSREPDSPMGAQHERPVSGSPEPIREPEREPAPAASAPAAPEPVTAAPAAQPAPERTPQVAPAPQPAAPVQPVQAPAVPTFGRR